MENVHIPVLLKEIIGFLEPTPGQMHIDATANGGGHAFAIHGLIQPGGRLLAIEWDADLAARLQVEAQERQLTDSFQAVHASYTSLTEVATERGFIGCQGVLFDLGMSSFHIDASGRGFTFQADEPLDMRFDRTAEGETAAVIVNSYSEAELAGIIYTYGEERLSRQIAKAIVEARRRERILTTGQLVEIIRTAVPERYTHQKLHFATRTFQALRIAVNHELENIESGLKQAVEVLAVGGRLAVITFHSLEDRIVKHFFRSQGQLKTVSVLTKKPIVATDEEKRENPRSRSAKLRVIQKL